MRAITLMEAVSLPPVRDQALPTSFAGVAYSGGLIKSHGVVIDLSTVRVPPRMPLLWEHDRNEVIGVVQAAVIGSMGITVIGTLFSDIAGSRAVQVARLSRRGAPFQMSVGLYGFSEESTPAGQRIAVNDRVVAGPVTVLRMGIVRECSLVVLRADDLATVSLFSGKSKPVPSLPSMLNSRDIYARRRGQSRMS